MAKKFTIEVHHKKRAELPQWMLDHPDFTFKSTFQKREGPIAKGDAKRAMVADARRRMADGLSAKEAATKTENFVREEFRKRGQDISKLYPDLYGTIYKGLRHK